MLSITESSHLAAIYLGLVVLVVLAAHAGLYPGATSAYAADSMTSHPYRLAMAITMAGLATVLGMLSARWGDEAHNTLVGLGVLLAGGIVTGALLGAAPWVLYPGDQYPLTFMWLVVGAPVGLAVWLLARVLSGGD